MKAATLSKYPNCWQWPDERFEGLLDLANAIQTAFDITTGAGEVMEESEFTPELYPVLTPIRIAQRLHEAAQRIEELTEDA